MDDSPEDLSPEPLAAGTSNHVEDELQTLNWPGTKDRRWKIKEPPPEEESPKLKRHNTTKFDSDDEVIDLEETAVEAHPILDHTQPHDLRADIHGILRAAKHDRLARHRLAQRTP
jgi:hypothetical protein